MTIWTIAFFQATSSAACPSACRCRKRNEMVDGRQIIDHVVDCSGADKYTDIPLDVPLDTTR